MPTIYNPARLIAESAKSFLLGKRIKLPYSRAVPRDVLAVEIVDLHSGSEYGDECEEVGLRITLDSGNRKRIEEVSLDCDIEIFE